MVLAEGDVDAGRQGQSHGIGDIDRWALEIWA
jgi:hypothetical protein